jgi:hypothetical protein
VFEKGSNEREILRFIAPIILLFFSVFVGTCIFVMHKYGEIISLDWVVLACQVGIMWLGLWGYHKVDSWNSKKFETAAIAFIRSGEPKGFNFEVLMSFLSNLTISGLALILSVHLKKLILLNIYVTYSVIVVVWVIAIFLIMMSAINFIFQFVKNDYQEKTVYSICVLTAIVAFAIPIFVAKT